MKEMRMEVGRLGGLLAMCRGKRVKERGKEERWDGSSTVGRSALRDLAAPSSCPAPPRT